MMAAAQPGRNARGRHANEIMPAHRPTGFPFLGDWPKLAARPSLPGGGRASRLPPWAVCYVIKHLRSILFLSVLCFGGAEARVAEAPTRETLGAQRPIDASVARQWNEELLAAIRRDFARPTVHARNLFHVSAAGWDAWAAFDPTAQGWLVRERMSPPGTEGDASGNDPQALQRARETAISYAAYRILRARFARSPGAAVTLRALDQRMAALGLDTGFDDRSGPSPAALGNRIAAAYLAFGATDNANEAADYANRFYTSVNAPLVMTEPGNPNLADPNRYQPLSLPFFLDQAGNPVAAGFPEFLSPEWGQVTAFALDPSDLELVTDRDLEFDFWTWHDPGPPPRLGGPGDRDYKAGFAQVVEWSGLLDPADGVMIDISPASRGTSALAPIIGKGHLLNPATGAPYTPQRVPAGDYYRVLAEFWADGPDSETPPGHWFTIANTVTDHPALSRRIGGEGPALDPLEWDVKLYFALGGAMHDAAVSAWGVKGKYDYIRPVSAIRYMAGLGQSSDPSGPSYHPDGIPLRPGRIEVITAASSRPGARHAHLVGDDREHLGKIAVYAWRGPDFIDDPAIDVAGVGWIRAEDWWPYQRPSFVTPPFAGYVSGHSTYSRAAAELLEAFTGSAYFPGGLGEFPAPAGEFLVFEDGPSVDITLQWATYRDAADESGLSRIYGGIHPTADDIPGRLMGAVIGIEAWRKASRHFTGTALDKIEPRPFLPSSAPEGLAVFSGSWAEPGREGEGWSVIGLDPHSALIHWLRYDQTGAPTWLSALARRSGNVLAGRLVETRQAADGSRVETDQGSIALVLHSCDQLRIELRTMDAPLRSLRRVARRVNGLDGLACRPAVTGAPGPQALQSGVWSDDADERTTLLLHMNQPGHGLTYELGFDTDGQPRWRLGFGPLEDGVRLALQRFAPRVTAFDGDFDPTSLVLTPLAPAILEFDGCGQARQSGPGPENDARLTRNRSPKALACP